MHQMIDQALVNEYRFMLIDRYVLEHITGPAGTVVFMNLQVVHGSTVNMSPHKRIIL